MHQVQSNPTFYIFVRTDISLAQQLVQTNHATYQMAVKESADNTPNIVLVGVASQKALLRVIKKLNNFNIAHESFVESDNDMGLSAISTVSSLTNEQRTALKNYALWREQNIKLANAEIEEYN